MILILLTEEPSLGNFPADRCALATALAFILFLIVYVVNNRKS